MRLLSIISILLPTLLITFFLILLVPKQVYANHCVGGVAAGCAFGDFDLDGTPESIFPGECFYEAASSGNCENNAAPGPAGVPGMSVTDPNNNGNFMCQWMKDDFTAKFPQWAGITTSCVNACLESAVGPVIPRKFPGDSGGFYCTDPAADSPTSYDGNRITCCTWTLPPPPTPTGAPPTPTPTSAIL